MIDAVDFFGEKFRDLYIYYYYFFVVVEYVNYFNGDVVVPLFVLPFSFIRYIVTDK